jgi:anti-anti-sigma regulatory factor
VKFGPESGPSQTAINARMSTKTTKRKRAATAAATEPATAPGAATGGAQERSPAVASAPVKASSGAEPVISLFSNSTVKDAAALKDTLLQVIDSPRAVTIDAKSVERIDTAVIQVLCAFIRDRAARNLAVSWRGTPQPLLDAARLLGVGTLLALPSQATEA